MMSENDSCGRKPRIPRIAAAWLVLSAAGALAGGCGTAASANDAANEHAGTRVFASEVNLRASDVPGFKVVAATQGEQQAQPGPLPQRVEQCDGGPVVNGASRGVASPLFQMQKVPIQTVVSGVYLMRDPSAASAYITAADRWPGAALPSAGRNPKESWAGYARSGKDRSLRASPASGRCVGIGSAGVALSSRLEALQEQKRPELHGSALVHSRALRRGSLLHRWATKRSEGAGAFGTADRAQDRRSAAWPRPGSQALAERSWQSPVTPLRQATSARPAAAPSGST